MKNIIYYLLFTTLLTLGSVNAQSPSFLKNKGQVFDQNGAFNTDVQYVLSTSGYNVSFYQNHFSYEIFSEQEKDSTILNVERIELWFKNPNENVAILSFDKNKEVTNVFKNGKSFSNINSYQKILYKNIWNGVDVEFLIVNNQLKYNYIVNNTKLKSFELIVKGGTASIKDENVILNGKTKVVTENFPEVFYIDKNKNKEDATVKIEPTSKGLKYVLPKNRTKKLIIDPIAYGQEYTTYYGGAHMDFAYSIDLKKNNNVIISGYTVSTNNIATTGAYQTTLSDQDSFIAEFDYQGNRLWATYFGGTYVERNYSAALDTNDNIYIAGNTASIIGLATSGAYQQYISSGDDAFLAKFSNTGQLMWSTYYGGNNHELITKVKVDDSNKVYVTGHTLSSDLPCSANAYRNSLSGNENAFLGVFDANGNEIYNSYYIKGSNTKGEDIAVTPNGTIYIAGTTNDTEVISSSTVHQNQNGGYLDGFVLKITPQFQTVWKTYLGGWHNEILSGIALDSLENIYLTGKTKSNNAISTPLSFQPNYADVSNWEGFLIKLDSSSTREWGTYITAGGFDELKSIEVTDTAIWVLGLSDGNNLMTDSTAIQESNNGGYDNILLNFTKDGDLIWSTYFGGANNEFGNDLLVTNNQILIAGQTGSSSNLSTANAHQSQFGGHSFDGYWTKFCKPLAPSSISTVGSVTFCEGDSIGVSSINQFNEYTWSNGATDSSLMIFTAGNYVLKTRDANNCPGRSDTLKVIVIPAINTEVQASSLAICNNSSVTLSLTGSFSSVVWNNNVTTNNQTVNTVGDYYATVTSSQGCESYSDTVELFSPQYAFNVLLIGDTIICAGGESILHTEASYNSLMWNNSETSSSITVNTAGDYYFTGVDTNSCPIISDTISISQTNYSTSGAVLDTLALFSICWNDSVVLSAENDFDSYVWSNGTQLQVATITEEGYYYVSATDSNGCVGISDSIQVVFKSDGNVLIDVSKGSSFCEGDSLLITADSLFQNIEWSTSLTNQDSLYVNAGGNYFYSAIDTASCPVYSDTVFITENGLPNVVIGNNIPDTLCLNDSFMIYSLNHMDSYSWSTGQTAEHFNLSFTNAGFHNVILEGTDYNGCVNTDTVEVFVFDCVLFSSVSKENNNPIQVVISNNQVYVESNQSIKKVTLVDYSGKRIKEILSPNKSLKFDVPTLSTGIYILLIEFEEEGKQIAVKLKL